MSQISQIQLELYDACREIDQQRIQIIELQKTLIGYMSREIESRKGRTLTALPHQEGSND